MDLGGGHDKDAGSLKGIWPSRPVIGSGYRERDGGGETMRDSWGEMERERGSGRNKDDEGDDADAERRRYGADEGGNKNGGRSGNAQSGRREKCRWRLGCSGQDRQEEHKGRRKREQSELSSFVSPSPSGSEAGSKLANMWDGERSLSFLLRLGRQVCPVLDSAEGRLKSDPNPRRNSDSVSVSDTPRTIPLPEPTSQPGNGSISPRLNLRGGAGSKRLDDDERVPKVIWFLAGGVGRAPTGKSLREWKEKARKKDQGRTKEKAGFWGKIGLGMKKKGKTWKQEVAKERKGSAEGDANGAQAAGGGVVRGDTWGDAGDVPGGPGGESGAAPGTGESRLAGEGSARGGAANSGSGRGSGSGSGSSSSGSGSGNSGRTE